jgi:hypothetical protein
MMILFQIQIQLITIFMDLHGHKVKVKFQTINQLKIV